MSLRLLALGIALLAGAFFVVLPRVLTGEAAEKVEPVTFGPKPQVERGDPVEAGPPSVVRRDAISLAGGPPPQVTTGAAISAPGTGGDDRNGSPPGRGSATGRGGDDDRGDDDDSAEGDD